MHRYRITREGISIWQGVDQTDRAALCQSENVDSVYLSSNITAAIWIPLTLPRDLPHRAIYGTSYESCGCEWSPVLDGLIYVTPRVTTSVDVAHHPASSKLCSFTSSMTSTAPHHPPPPSSLVPTITPARLSTLAIYNPSLGPTDETLSDQIVFFTTSRTSAGTAENDKLRQIGLAQGVVEFARYVHS